MCIRDSMYAAIGYVVYTLNPSGTTGFGQEFAARHVNAWGDKTADEIIQGTEQFCKEHPFVNPVSYTHLFRSKRYGKVSNMWSN